MADTTPSEAGFITFCRNVAGITTTCMPDGDAGFDDAYAFALEWTPEQMRCMSGLLYTAAVYNLGVSLLVQFQLDQSGQTFFDKLREKFKTNSFVAGVVSSSSDESTSASLTVGQQLANMSLFDLQRLTDPFGRQWLAICGQLGPNVWGLS